MSAAVTRVSKRHRPPYSSPLLTPYSAEEAAQVAGGGEGGDTAEERVDQLR